MRDSTTWPVNVLVSTTDCQSGEQSYCAYDVPAEMTVRELAVRLLGRHNRSDHIEIRLAEPLEVHHG